MDGMDGSKMLGGNTILPVKDEMKVEKRLSQRKRWCFTWNNYPVDGMDALFDCFTKLDAEFIMGLEVGESKTPHIQGYVEFQKACRYSALGLPKTIHWEAAKGNRQANLNYCSKDGEFRCSPKMKPPRKLKLITPGGPGYEWETDILEDLKEEPDDRRICWYWSEDGKTGKTSFCKYVLNTHQDVIVTGGKAADIRNQISDYKKNNDKVPDIILINIPRSFDQSYLSYEGIENIKDMIFYSGKYEGGMIGVGDPSPHLYIFANEPPNEAKCSADRWQIVNIDVRA
jgi:hypothetical protein